MSPEGDQGFFANGLTEELIHTLDLLDGLAVVGRDLSIALKNRGDDLHSIGRQLGVSYLLDGSIRQVGGESRVVAKLSNVQSGLIVWSDAYVAEFEDLFAVQERIAEAVSTALSIELRVGNLAEIDGGTDDIHAYQEYRLARAEHVALESDAFKVIHHYERATELDPDFALAWAGLAEACHVASWSRMRGEGERLTERRDTAISKALSLAPRSAEVLKIKAQLDIWQGRFRDARLSLEKLHSRDTGRGIRYSMVDLDLFLKTGRLRDALLAISAIKRRDPLNPWLPLSESQMYFITGRTDDALAVRERLFHAGKGGVNLANVTVPVALSSGRREEIEKWLRRADDIARPNNLGYRTIWQSLLETFDDRDALLELLRSQQSRGFFDNFAPLFAAWLGEDEMALESMRRYPDPWFMWSPLYERLRKTDEFKQIVIDLELVDYWNEFGWGDFCKPTVGDEFECR
jgi:TolB-like protein